MVRFYFDRILFFLVCLAKDIGFRAVLFVFLYLSVTLPSCFVPIKKSVFGNFATSKNK